MNFFLADLTSLNCFLFYQALDANKELPNTIHAKLQQAPLNFQHRINHLFVHQVNTYKDNRHSKCHSTTPTKMIGIESTYLLRGMWDVGAPPLDWHGIQQLLKPTTPPFPLKQTNFNHGRAQYQPNAKTTAPHRSPMGWIMDRSVFSRRPSSWSFIARRYI